MITTPLDKLGYPFHGFDKSTSDDADLIFSYHVIFQESTPIKGRCNDIICDECLFQPDCENGKHMSATLVEYAKDKFPEFLI